LERPWVIYLQLRNVVVVIGIIIAIAVLAAYVMYIQGQGQPTQTTTQTTTTTKTQTTTQTSLSQANFTIECSFQSPYTLKTLVSGPARNIYIILENPDGEAIRKTFIAKEKLSNGSTTISFDLANSGQMSMSGVYTIIITVQPNEEEVYRTTYLVSTTPA
jgi:hypothetical protein